MEKTYQLTTETDLLDTAYCQKIEKFYASGKEGFLTGKADVKIYYRLFEQTNTQKAILISTGRTEAALKYKELIFDLFMNGYSVYIHDHRGQGLSGRMTENLEMGYVDTFQFYIDDMHYFYTQFIEKKHYEKTYLLSHSLGGAIGMTYLEQYPYDFNAAAFSSPMLGFNPPICMLATILDGNQVKYAMGQEGYKDDKTTFEGNTITGSQIRYNRMIDAYDKEPKAKLGGVTYTWIHKSCKQYKYIFSHIDSIKTPFILFSAEVEQIVNPSAHQKFISAAKKRAKTCEAFEVGNAQHELLFEKDVQRIETINKILDFYSKY